jgi:thiamine kinase-like enzyme
LKLIYQGKTVSHKANINVQTLQEYADKLREVHCGTPLMLWLEKTNVYFE